MKRNDNFISIILFLNKADTQHNLVNIILYVSSETDEAIWHELFVTDFMAHVIQSYSEYYNVMSFNR